MKVTGITTHIVDAYRANYVFVRITTDAGMSGVGEATVEHREPTVAAAIDELARHLVGQDPFRIDHHIEVMTRDSYWRTGVILRSALSAVELALQDLKGKALGVPVVRPHIAETTALGAAYFAGLSVGFWSGVDTIASQWREERRFAPAQDDIIAPKTGTRGQVWEGYVTHRVAKSFVVKLGYIRYDYDYSGSGWHLGAPKDLDDTQILGFPTYDEASKLSLSFSARF